MSPGPWLRDPTTFLARTIESLLATPGALPQDTVALLRENYFASACGGLRCPGSPFTP